MHPYMCVCLFVWMYVQWWCVSIYTSHCLFSIQSLGTVNSLPFPISTN